MNQSWIVGHYYKHQLSTPLVHRSCEDETLTYVNRNDMREESIENERPDEGIGPVS